MYTLKFGVSHNEVCKTCTSETGRSATCHSTCEKYLKELELNSVKREAANKQKETDALAEQYRAKAESCFRMIRRKYRETKRN